MHITPSTLSLFASRLRRIALLASLVGASSGLGAQTVTVSPGNADIRDRLEIEALVLQAKPDASAGELIATADGDYSRILAALYEEGYFGASVSIKLGGREAAGLSALNAPATLQPVIIDVDLGPRFTFGRAQIEPRAPGSEHPEGFAIGAPAGTAAIRSAALGAVDDWKEASHAKARISGQEIVARHRQAELDVAITIDPGPALLFGDLVTPPDPEFRRSRLLKIAGLPTSEPYSPEALHQARARLVATGAFNSLVLEEAEAPEPNQTLPITLSYEAAPPRRLGFGAEVDTTSGLSLQTFWLHRNFFGGAERLRFDAKAEGIGGPSGGTDYSFDALLRVPGFRRADDTLELSAGLGRIDDDTVDETLFELGIRRARQVNETLVVGTSLGFRFSEAEDIGGKTEFRHFIISADAERDLRDNALNPTSGTYGFLELTPFIGLGDSKTGVRLKGDFRAYRTFGDGLVVAARGQLGVAAGPEIAEVPPEFLFFSGGGGTVRGQGFKSLGVGSGASQTGGRGFAGLSLELRRDMTETLSLVGFMDHGYISSGYDFSDGASHSGAGLGIRYKTSFGPLRADLGFPVGGSTDGTDYGLYIGLGQAF